MTPFNLLVNRRYFPIITPCSVCVVSRLLLQAVITGTGWGCQLLIWRRSPDQAASSPLQTAALLNWFVIKCGDFPPFGVFEVVFTIFVVRVLLILIDIFPPSIQISVVFVDLLRKAPSLLWKRQKCELFPSGLSGFCSPTTGYEINCFGLLSCWSDQRVNKNKKRSCLMM